MTNEKTIGRIRKLLAMADKESGASDQERETALRRANSLMDKYNVSMMDVSEDARGEDERNCESIATGTVKWKAAVISVIGKLYGVFVYRTTGRDGCTFFVGRESSRVAVRYISEYLIRSIEAEAKTVIGDRAYKTLSAWARLPASRNPSMQLSTNVSAQRTAEGLIPAR